MIRHNIKSDELRAFVAVADSGGFATAAELMRRTQSALTQQVKRLESNIGCRLLIRTQGRYSGLTEEGLRLLPHAREMVSVIERAYLSVQNRPLTGYLRIGLMDDFDFPLLPEIIAKFKRSYPMICLSVISDFSEKLSDRIIKKELDIAIIKRMSDRPCNDDHLILKSEPLHWVTNRSNSALTQIPIPLILFHQGCIYRECATRILSNNNKQWYLSYVGNSYSSVKNAISAGLGISALPLSSIDEEHVIIDDYKELPKLGFVDSALIVTKNSNVDVIETFTKHLIHGITSNG